MHVVSIVHLLDTKYQVLLKCGQEINKEKKDLSYFLFIFVFFVFLARNDKLALSRKPGLSDCDCLKCSIRKQTSF